MLILIVISVYCASLSQMSMLFFLNNLFYIFFSEDLEFFKPILIIIMLLISNEKYLSIDINKRTTKENTKKDNTNNFGEC